MKDKEEMRDIIFEASNEAFYHLCEKFDLETGDITPGESVTLDRIVKKLIDINTGNIELDHKEKVKYESLQILFDVLDEKVDLDMRYISPEDLESLYKIMDGFIIGNQHNKE